MTASDTTRRVVRQEGGYWHADASRSWSSYRARHEHQIARYPYEGVFKREARVFLANPAKVAWWADMLGIDEGALHRQVQEYLSQ